MFNYIDESERKSYIIKLIVDGRICLFYDNDMEAEEKDDEICWTCTCGNFESDEI